MDWEVIIKAYPEDEDGIKSARRVHEAVYEAVAGLEVPLLESAPAAGEIVSVLPVSDLAGICRTVWRDVLGQEPDVDFEKALRAFLSEDEGPQSEDDADETLSIFLRPVVTAFMKRLREKNAGLVPEGWSEGECPFCGSQPGICFDSESSRNLHCLTCGQQWRFRRVKCPFCGNSDHTTLGYFDAEGIEGVRVYYCSQCRHYIKVINIKQHIAHDAETEDILSLALDAVAQEEGYI